MKHNAPSTRRTGMQTSPWIILGSTVILLVVVVVLAVQNAHREKQSMIKVLRAKGAALIRAVEAGARTGMRGMQWGGGQIQLLLEETGQLPDVLYMAVVDDQGVAVAHSDPSKINTLFRSGSKLIHLGPDLKENWELVDSGNNQRVFEVHRHFSPFIDGRGGGWGRRGGMPRHHMMMNGSEDDWFAPNKRDTLLIVVGLDVAPFEVSIRQDIRTTVIFSVILLFLGFGGFVSLFWMQSYREAKRSLQDTSAFADEVVTHLPVGLIATDSNGHITFFNDTAGRITGITPAAAMGQLPDRLLPDGLCGLWQTPDSGVTVVEKEMDCRFADDRMVPLSVSATSIVNEEGRYVGQIMILRDLREVRRLQQEVRRQEKLAALGGLAAGVAHEIRNPLSSIKGLATYFADQFPEGSDAREATGVMIHEVDRLNRAISELLDFARPTDLKRALTDIGPLITHSIQLIQQDAVAKQIRINTHIDPALCQALIDPDRLTQCLLNIYLNAIQAMPEGGELTVRCNITADHRLCMAVSDTGHGIPSDQLGNVFDPYFTTKNKGTGLGLAIVHKIVESHQGAIDVESTPGRGTTIKIVLPCRPDENTTHDSGIAR